MTKFVGGNFAEGPSSPLTSPDLTFRGRERDDDYWSSAGCPLAEDQIGGALRSSGTPDSSFGIVDDGASPSVDVGGHVLNECWRLDANGRGQYGRSQLGNQLLA